MLFKNQYPKMLASAVDPYKLSLTIKGILTGLIPVVLVLAPMFHWTVTQSDFDSLTSAIQSIIVSGTAVVSGAMIVWGLVRKLLVAFNLYTK